MSREQEIQSHWHAVELIAGQWAQSLRLDYPLIPLSHLKAHWDAAVHGPRPARDTLRTDALVIENVALKQEVALLRRRLENQMATTTPAPTYSAHGLRNTN